MAVDRLRRWAATAPVPVFVARGGGSGLLATELSADARLRMVASPRHASVLLATGRFPGSMGMALNRVHDQLPAPCRTVWWTADPTAERPAALQHAVLATGDDPVAAIAAAHREVCSGSGDPAGDVLADVPPNAFRGLGDYGQGGEGMMGGVPFGRPMAMTGDDRDGLALDRLPVTLGPFLSGFPNGLQVRAVLQGGVMQEAELLRLDLGSGPSLDRTDRSTSAGHARHELRWLAEVLLLSGLGALAARAAQLARGAPDPAGRAGLVRRIRRSGLPSAWSGVGVLDGVDARDRLRRHLAGGADDPFADVPLERVAGVLVGQDWGDAVVTICSLDLSTDRSAEMMVHR